MVRKSAYLQILKGDPQPMTLTMHGSRVCCRRRDNATGALQPIASNNATVGHSDILQEAAAGLEAKLS